MDRISSTQVNCQSIVVYSDKKYCKKKVIRVMMSFVKI